MLQELRQILEKALGPFNEVNWEGNEYLRVSIQQGDDFELCIGRKRDIKKAENGERAFFVECLQYTKIDERYRKNFPNLVEVGRCANLQFDTFYEYMFSRGNEKIANPQISILMRLDETWKVEPVSEKIQLFLKQFRG